MYEWEIRTKCGLKLPILTVRVTLLSAPVRSPLSHYETTGSRSHPHRMLPNGFRLTIDLWDATPFVKHFFDSYRTIVRLASSARKPNCFLSFL
jgi:hypothetical protein